VKLRVVDEATGEPLVGASVRFLNPPRFASTVNQSEFDLRLSAGAWSMCVLAEGHETELRENVVVAPDGVNDLGEIALAKGSGTIEGRLSRDGIETSGPRYVELRGAGRNPCPECFQHGPDVICCGWSWDRSVVAIGADGRFCFRALAAGTYFLRALDQSPRPVPTRRLELKRGEWRQVDLAFAIGVVAKLELVDDQAQAFVGAWAQGDAGAPEPIHFEVEIDGVLLRFDATPDPADLRARVGPPPLCDAAAVNAVAAGRASREFEIWFNDGGVAADRPRKPEDELLPSAGTPGYAVVELACGRTAPNRYFVHDLPASRVKLRAHCGAFVADEIELDLADPRQREARLVFHATAR
jgi:hypothetical protein